MKKGNNCYFIGLVCLVGIGYAVCAYYLVSSIFMMPGYLGLMIICAMLCLFSAAVLLNTQKSTETENRRVQNLIVYCVTSACMPLIVLFHYISRNAEYFALTDCFALGFVLSVFSITVYLLFSARVDKCSALLPVLLLWVFFWIDRSIFSKVPPALTALICVCVIAVVGFIIPRIKIDRLVCNTFAAVVCLLAVFNVCAALFQYAQISMKGDALFQPKTEFTIDEKCDSPDIYWFHMDGMMGFDEIKKIFGDDQVELKAALNQRGFLINEGAALDVGWTTYALPALTSPDVYDNYMHKKMDEMPELNGVERKKALGSEALAIFKIYPQLELFNAFLRKHYKTYYVVFDIGNGVTKIPDSLEFTESVHETKRANLVDFLAKYSILCLADEQMSKIIKGYTNLAYFSNLDPKIFQYVNPESNCTVNFVEHYDWVCANIFEITTEGSSPKLVYFQNVIPHFPFKSDENGIDQEVSSRYEMANYMPQHRYSARVMLGMIDRVLQENPDSVIIVQGDHGVHDVTNRQDLKIQGFTDEDILEMNYSTISAVRVPEKYDVLTEPLDPLDLTRYLVNHFVGEGNYDYLLYKED